MGRGSFMNVEQENQLDRKNRVGEEGVGVSQIQKR